ncbi:HEAT repeat containing protein [Metarhizium album ARSEF 1941]|uniref:HEAT repeat containing protein n=1 Tax=Metarhizium album (strain ARSEF 1941) TaxID=1081103 RepID=A0A0B2WEF4_METAS|nr:HEAT repeat containing protein [Metarhizium album ARSEF 1941]KHN94226.1 HEAT repeat containing protein [Metarhizium album ARSEF 1941]
MADKLTEAQVADLLTILRSDSSLDARVQFVTAIKSAIKQHNVPESCVAQLFDGLRTASSAQHAALVNAGFTALNHLLTRLSRQDPKLLAREAARTLPLVIEKLGDQKDKYRSLAIQSLNTLYAASPADVERFVRNSALGGKNPRAKEGGMHWLLQMHQEHGMPFRGYVPMLMELLEDADGMVRDTAKATVIDLFKTAPNTAKSDLKRQLKNFKVRPAIEQAIVKALAPAGGRPETPADCAPSLSSQPSRSTFVASASSLATERPMTPMPDAADAVDPQYVNTNRELDDIFKEMAWFFDGKETEQNWLKREQSINTLRRLNAGNAATDFQDVFVSGLRAMLDGIIKTINSLRTSLSKEGCALIQEIAVSLGPAMDPMVELLMQTLVKLSAGTKKISSQMANVTVNTIISRVTYNQRLMQHIWGASQDKNVQPRTYATGWLKTVLKKEAGHKSHIEHTGGVDLMEKCIRKGLGDANPGVREKTRSAFWAFWGVFPARADAIMADLDSTAQKLLNKDPSNPNSPKKTDAPARPGLGFSRSTTTSSKTSLREAMMAQKKAMAVKNLPARPGSAMAHISSPVRTMSNTSTHSTTATKSAATRTRTESTLSVNAGGMSVAPMRPARHRPEMAARPATAGPYSTRDRSGLDADSPEGIKSKRVNPKAPKAVTPKKTLPKARPGHASHASDSSIPSPTFPSAHKRVASSRASPVLLKPSQTSPASSSRAAPVHNESEPAPAPNFASPQVSAPEQAAEPQEPPGTATRESKPRCQDQSPSRTLKVYEDPFTDSAPSATKPAFTVPVLEDKPVNEDAARLPKQNGDSPMPDVSDSPEKTRQNSKLLDSGITKIKSKNLEVHGFRKLQSLIRDSKTVLTDERFEALLLGLFLYLEDPLPGNPAEKVQDVKAQILSTIKLLLRRERDNFQPHVSKGLESLLETRGAYDTRAHVVSGLELLADELVTIGDGSEIVAVLTQRLETCTDATTQGCRALSMGLHVLKEMLDKRTEFVPTDRELAQLTDLSSRCLGSGDSGVRMDAVKFCVSLHDRVGDAGFWGAFKDVKEDPKSLITYYIVKKQREQGSAA